MWVSLATQVKTLRLPEDVVETINDFPGSTFTEKFVATARLLGRDREKLQQQLQNMEQEKQRKLLYLADLGKITRKKENIQCTLDEIFWKMSEVQRMCKTVQGATSTLVSDSSDSK